ncbi:hypothetical protein [Amycolatopsis sp. H20-H5]|uniref:hypothetical protein n=1 Tax=Amycolatopsis sp. H20-H5 TaxID=3046309 RepID=UPI002DB75821|nr:hypothetical protein [Amycolatopsis sp. H20-H5]MEC3978062.1 hypothetical protein [Amycolatopsis sp. H20-H5]
MVTIKVTEFDTAAAVEAYKLSWRTNRATLRLLVDLARSELTLTLLDRHIVNTTSATTISVALPLLHTQAAKSLLGRFTNPAQRIIDGATLHSGRASPPYHLNDDAVAALHEIRSAADAMSSQPGNSVLYVQSANVIPVGYVDPDATDAQLEEQAARILVEQRITTRRTVVPGLLDYLRLNQNANRVKRLDELADVADTIATTISARNRLIRSLASFNKPDGRRMYSDRHIAQRAQLSHTAVQQIRKQQTNLDS